MNTFQALAGEDTGLRALIYFIKDLSLRKNVTSTQMQPSKLTILRLLTPF